MWPAMSPTVVILELSHTSSAALLGDVPQTPTYPISPFPHPSTSTQHALRPRITKAPFPTAGKRWKRGLGL